ncbi:MAG TPA: hypothetical protein VF407_14620 [Polyangiaceae bacterium]
MRPDMSKVIVERPRLRFPLKNGSAYPRGHLKNRFLPNLEDAPSRESMGGVYAEKRLNENLQPLVRFLRSNVGRPWNAVRSEIAARISCKSAVQKHVLDHLRDYVTENVEILDGEVFACNSRWGSWHHAIYSYGMRFRFYVAPRTGLLVLAPLRTRKAWKDERPDPDRRIESDTIELRKIAGVWYELTLALIAKGDRTHVPDVHRPRFYVTKKRQLSSREISARGLRSKAS